MLFRSPQCLCLPEAQEDAYYPSNEVWESSSSSWEEYSTIKDRRSRRKEERIPIMPGIHGGTKLLTCSGHSIKHPPGETLPHTFLFKRTKTNLLARHFHHWQNIFTVRLGGFLKRFANEKQGETPQRWPDNVSFPTFLLANGSISIRKVEKSQVKLFHAPQRHLSRGKMVTAAKGVREEPVSAAPKIEPKQGN